MLSAEVLYEKYHIDGMSLIEIGKECGVCHVSVLNWMKKYGIKRRQKYMAWKNKKRSDKTKKKVSESLKKRYSNGMIHSMQGKRHTIEARKKMSKSIKKVWAEDRENRLKKCLAHLKNQKGENHPMWKGGISKEEYGEEFDNVLKCKIQKRDNYKCKICGEKLRRGSKKFDVHHIDQNKKNNKEDNLVLLCTSCHIVGHHNVFPDLKSGIQN